MLNIPIYRAKKIDSDEYIEGYLTAYAEKVFDKTKVNKIRIDAVYHINDDEIDLSTLAIHFPDMIDSEGTKIFASLSEDGRGGDNLKTHSGKHARLIYKENTMQWDIYTQYSEPKIFGLCSARHLKLSKVTGIQE